VIRLSIEERKTVTTTNIATPSVGIEGVNHAVRALWVYKDPATYKDLAKGANLHPIYMSQSLSAARDVGFAELAGRRGLYKLTSGGVEYARQLSYGDESKCKELIRKTLLENPLWSEIFRFLRMGAGQERDPLSLIADIEAKLGKRWSASMRGGYAKAYTSILEYAGLIKTAGQKIISQMEMEEKPETPETLPSASPQEATTLPPMPEGYAEFSIPDSFKVFIRKSKDSLEFFENQIKENSIFAPWIQHEKKKLGEAG